MAKSNVVELSGRDTIDDPLTELLRTGAEQTDLPGGGCRAAGVAGRPLTSGSGRW